MAVNVLSGIVRIVSGRHIGTGFVVTTDGLILTCAHVLGSSMPEKARVVFLGSGEECEATVLAEGWRGVDAEDVAALRVSGALPEGVQPLPLGSSQGIIAWVPVGVHFIFCTGRTRAEARTEASSRPYRPLRSLLRG